MKMITAKGIISLEWFLMGLSLVLLFIFQDSLGRYDDASDQARTWLLSRLIPIFTLIITAWVVEHGRKDKEIREISMYLVVIACLTSLLYLFLIGLPVLAIPFSEKSPAVWMSLLEDWILGINGILGLVLGIFFSSQKTALKQTTMSA